MKHRRMRALSLLLCGLVLAAGCAQKQSPGASEKMGPIDLAFPAVPAGYRSLGGVLFRDNTNFVIAPEEGQPGARSDDMMAGLAHNMAVGSSGVDPENRIAAADCQGSGETPENAIQVMNLADLAEQIRAAHACARLRHPSATWRITQLIAKDDNYISQIVLQDRTRRAVVYVDVNRYVKQVLSEIKA